MKIDYYNFTQQNVAEKYVYYEVEGEGEYPVVKLFCWLSKSLDGYKSGHELFSKESIWVVAD